MTEQQSVYFHGTSKSYTLKDLEVLTLKNLVSLRNQVAAALGENPIAKFSDKPKGIKTTWHVLNKYQELKGSDKPKAAKESKSPVVRPVAKAAGENYIKRPKRSHFDTIKKIGEHDGTQPRPNRWPNYKDGMTMAEVEETSGCIPWDVKQWVKCGIMEIVPCTDAEYAERRAAWFSKEGRDDPEIVKQREAEEKAARVKTAKAKQGVKDESAE